ncbi:uncharacterized protein TM35_000292500 [Trypanosoma theileri]|uniref:Uncharacterized protein n=1 Tax=Trypanosoma theileri TaxID=67003 RepID=A0A1X0NPB8_9TRYP|nr:uncharacterized protein TM35_000292500 [Trypanosoma theileri]ORC86368.1 hypothetical protein TM35_000292500 [Trypanosoma theileri]
MSFPPAPPTAAIPAPPTAGVPAPPTAAIPAPPTAAVPAPPTAAVPPPPPTAAIPAPPTAAIPAPPTAGVPPPPPTAGVPAPPTAGVPPPPPTAAVPPPPTAAIPAPPTAAIPAPPTAAIPAPPTAAVPPPPPTAAVPAPPTAAVPPPPPTAGVPPALSTAAVPAPPTAAVPPPPPTAAVPAPPTAGVPAPPTAGVPPALSTAAAPLAPGTVPLPAMPAAATATGMSPLSNAPLLGATALPPQLQTASYPPNAVGPLPKPLISEETRRQLEEAVLQQFKSAAGDQYLDLDEVVRDHVCKLFFLSNYEVGTMMSNIVKGLQCLGRYDVGLLRNDDSTAFTVIQSPPFNEALVTDESQEVERRRQAIREGQNRIERADNRSKARFLGVAKTGVETKEGANYGSSQRVEKNVTKGATNLPKSSYEHIQELLRARQIKKSGGRRSASANPHSQRHASPAGDGYLLWRYGGNYPKENYYEHYRLYGLKK